MMGPVSECRTKRDRPYDDAEPAVAGWFSNKNAWIPSVACFASLILRPHFMRDGLEERAKLGAIDFGIGALAWSGIWALS